MTDRALPEYDLAVIREHVRAWLAEAPDPLSWPVERQWVLALLRASERLARIEQGPAKNTVASSARKTARESGYTGDSCDKCGSLSMVRAGPCAVCQECGSTSGGCS